MNLALSAVEVKLDAFILHAQNNIFLEVWSGISILSSPQRELKMVPLPCFESL